MAQPNNNVQEALNFIDEFVKQIGATPSLLFLQAVQTLPPDTLETKMRELAEIAQQEQNQIKEQEQGQPPAEQQPTPEEQGGYNLYGA